MSVLCKDMIIRRSALIICCAFYFISLYIELNFLFTDSYYRDVFAGANTDIHTLLSRIHATNWLNYLIAPIYVLVLSSSFAIALYIVFTLTNHKVLFKNCFFAGIVGQLVFAINYFITVLLKYIGIVAFNSKTADDVFYYQSIAPLIKNLPEWCLFACERVSVIEAIYISIVSYTVYRIFNISLIKSFGIVFLIELFALSFISIIQICHYVAVL